MTTAPIDLDTLRSAHKAGEFFLLYQPIVRLRDGGCFGAEALIRWQRRDVVVDAAAFIPLTEQTPLSGMLTYWVIDTVAEQLHDWLAANPAGSISINVPPEVLGRGGLEYTTSKSRLNRYSKQLILEITERGVPDQLGLSALNSIPGTGVRVALDDTTLTGANLALLTRCHFDFIKIDHLLVGELAVDKPRPHWLDGLGALLHTTSLQVIAEGVENAYQVEALAAAGVQLAQGHYYSAPLDVKSFQNYYAARPMDE